MTNTFEIGGIQVEVGYEYYSEPGKWYNEDYSGLPPSEDITINSVKTSDNITLLLDSYTMVGTIYLKLKELISEYERNRED